MLQGEKAWKNNYFKDINAHGRRDLKQSINLLTNLQILEILCRRKIYVFGVARGYLPQFMVPKGGKEAKALLLAF